MLKRRKPLTLPRLTDVTLMGADARGAAPDAIRRLYLALLDVGVMVQIPAETAQRFGESLATERTLLAAGTERTAAGGFAGILSDACRPWQTRVMKECTLGMEVFPEADTYRLTVDAALFLGNYEAQFTRLLRRAPRPVMLCARGETQFATALSVCWLLLGGAGAAASLTGADGHASLPALLMALALHGESGLHAAALPAAAAAWEALTGKRTPPYQPVIGPRIFDVSSGVHVNGLLKDSESYEPFAPEAVGRRRRIVLDQHSGQSAVAARLHAMEIRPDTLDLPLLTQRVRALGRACGAVDDAAFAALIRQAQRDACA